ncbi:MAG: Phosphatidylglycerophosphatase B [Chloroflexi bacterium]|nr:Phosphatidylglycerophosphatase B [Chloroflexota bacterium]
MDTILDLNIPLIVFIQNLGAWIETPMKFFTFLGNEEFYLLIMPLLYWSIDAQLGFRLGAMLLLSGSLNSTLKILFHSPRPYWYTTQVRAISSGEAFGFPSGHAQNAASLWGLGAASLKRRWAWIAAIFVIFFIGLSRIYLGVHFPVDVLTGWAVGALFLWVFLKAEKPLETWFKEQSLSAQLGACFGVSVLIVMAGILAKATLGTWQVPQIWFENAASEIAPLSLQGFFTTAGTFLGLGWGAILYAHHTGPLDVSGTFLQRALRYVLGLVGVIVIYAGLDALFLEGEAPLALGLRYLRYTFVGAWISLGAPLIFWRLKLVPRSPVSSGE